jgi:Tol biopolymer transport system component
VLGAGAIVFFGTANHGEGAGTAPASHAKAARLASPPSNWSSGQLAISDIDGTTLANGDATHRRLVRAPRSQVSFTPDGREITYLQRNGLMVSRSLSTGQAQTLTRLRAGQWAYPRWSPDGTSLAFAYGTIPGPTRIDTVGQDGTHRHLVATDAGPYFHWSPTGRWIGYVNSTGIMLVRPDGSDRHLAITGRSLGTDSLFSDFSWSPDGTHIAFVDGTRHHQAVFTERIDGTDRRAIATGHGLGEAQWSPNGRFIAYVHAGEVIVHRLATGADTVVARPGWGLQWSPNGRWIAYIADRLGIVSVRTVSRDGSQHHQIGPFHKPEILVWGASPTP